MTARPNATTRKNCLDPVVDARVRLLILGSLPGERSLAAARYYAHPQNQFWRLIGAVIGRDLTALAYPERLAALLASRVGLWDTIAAAERTGSSDAALREPIANDLLSLAADLPHLAAIGFNGMAAWRIGTRTLGADGLPGVARIALPSSSPLHTIGLPAKLSAWQALGTFIDR